MATKPSYDEMVKADMEQRINALDLDPLQKDALLSRWLDQMVWMGERAGKAQRRYYALRLTTVIGGVILPALVGNILGTDDPNDVMRWTTFVISLLVAVSAALEEFFHFGDRWRHYRQSAEWLKIEGWRFFVGSGPYRRYKTHSAAYSIFAERVEDILKADVEHFLGRVVQEDKEEYQPGVIG